MRVMRRTLTTLAATVLAYALLAPAALAIDSSQGTYGEADDKVVTNAGFILIAFFPLFILLMSLLQWRLDKRKQARKAAAKGRAGSKVWTSGW
jgi:hypothetical protein